MKKIAFLFTLLLVAVASFAQPASPGTGVTKAGWSWYGQALNLSNTYANPTSDSLLGSGVTKYFTIGTKNSTTGVPSAAAYIPSSGKIMYDISAKMASTSSTVNPVVSVTPQRKTAGGTWVDVPGESTYTVTATSRTTAVTKGITMTAIPGPYERLKVTNTDTAAVQIYFQVDFTQPGQ